MRLVRCDALEIRRAAFGIDVGAETAARRAATGSRSRRRRRRESPRNASTSRRWNGMRCRGIVSDGARDAEPRRSTRDRRRDRRDVRDRFLRWMIRIALTASRAKASAISATTSDCDRRRLRAPADARAPSPSASAGAVRSACQSGARLDRTLATIAAPAANNTTAQIDGDLLRAGEIVRGHRHHCRVSA